MVSYSPLWETIKKRSSSTYTLIYKCDINSQTINNLKHNKSITIYTLERLYEILDCEPNDIIKLKNEATGLIHSGSLN